MGKGIEYLNVTGIRLAQISVDKAVKEFINQKKEMQNTTRKLLSTWVGKGRNEFQTQTDLINSRLEDISEELSDIYELLVDAERTYIDADEAAAKAQ